MPDYLLIDAGNSRLKWAISRQGVLTDVGIFDYTENELAALFSEWSSFPLKFSAVLLASVAEAMLAKRLADWIKENLGLPVQIVATATEQCGVKNCYAQADRLGVDRWLAMIGARQLLDGAVCVIDCGTATTVDVVDASGQHMGGLIVPGVELMAASLLDRAAGLRTDGIASCHGLLACDTLAAIQGGSLQATAGFIERIHEEICGMVSTPLTTLLCGGGAEDLLPLLSVETRYEPNLVLIGLNTIAMTNT